MVTATAFNPGVITSLDGTTPSGPVASTQPLVTPQPASLTKVQIFPPPDVIPSRSSPDTQPSPLLQTTPTSTSPQVVFQAVAPVLQTPSATSPSAVTPPLNPPAPVTTTKIVLPDITQIEQQLKACGALISEIPEQPLPDNSPLAHLQPNVGQPPSTANPIFAQPSPVVPLPPIKLASTAPTKTTLTIPVAPPQPSVKEVSNLGHFLSSSFKWLFALSLIVVTVIAYHFLSANDPSMSLQQMFTQFAGQSDYIELDSETGQPEAVWYQ